ncbi:MAG: hypothetical protein JWN50_398 [Parcubacteria group bacterium]|nr:hypothetical protein [Parcubacteria group bacterium]
MFAGIIAFLIVTVLGITGVFIAKARAARPGRTPTATASGTTATGSTTSTPEKNYGGWIAGLAVAALTIFLVVWIGSKYFGGSSKPKIDPRIAAAEHRNDSLQVELKKALEGGKKWTSVIRKDAPDSVEIALGDSLFLQRQDSLPYLVVVGGRKFDVPLHITQKITLPKSGWVRVELDSTAKSDSIVIEYRSWRANWSS